MSEVSIMSKDTCDVFLIDEKTVNSLKSYLEDVSGVSELFKALSDESRSKILYLLSKKELCVCDIAALLDLSVSAVSHHLRYLRNLRLVKYRKEGKMAFYSLADDHVLSLIQMAIEHYMEE